MFQKFHTIKRIDVQYNIPEHFFNSIKNISSKCSTLKSNRNKWNRPEQIKKHLFHLLVI